MKKQNNYLPIYNRIFLSFCHFVIKTLFLIVLRRFFVMTDVMTKIVCF